MKRKLNGRRDGSQGFSEWFSCQLIAMGARRSKLHPSTFMFDDGVGGLACITAHVDDVAMFGATATLDEIQKNLEKVVVVKVTGVMMPGAVSEGWCTFLSVIDI